MTRLLSWKGRRMSQVAVLRDDSPDVATMPLADIDPAVPELFRNETVFAYFQRLRAEDPVHYCISPEHGPYWSITRHSDIVAVECNHKAFSSDMRFGGISLMDIQDDFRTPMFIA